ncbi:hypothetical protein [Nocardia sp. NPDC024068]|uniref:hypothetical protein n=1 Tax=Nocardia sp. NPDC024068 TaxID=3157197 RepID=UPI0033D94BFC
MTRLPPACIMPSPKPWRHEAGRALAAGISPDSAATAPIVDTLTARYAETFGKPDDDALRRRMLERLEVANVPRVAWYWQPLPACRGADRRTPARISACHRAARRRIRNR